MFESDASLLVLFFRRCVAPTGLPWGCELKIGDLNWTTASTVLLLDEEQHLFTYRFRLAEAKHQTWMSETRQLHPLYRETENVVSVNIYFPLT